MMHCIKAAVGCAGPWSPLFCRPPHPKAPSLLISVTHCTTIISCMVQAAKKLLEQNNTPTAALVGRYVATYNHIRKRSWWDLHLSGGTIVEQATHFVDMMRYLGGEIERDSIQAIAVGPDYPLAEMPRHPEGENEVQC